MNECIIVHQQDEYALHTLLNLVFYITAAKRGSAVLESIKKCILNCSKRAQRLIQHKRTKHKFCLILHCICVLVQHSWIISIRHFECCMPLHVYLSKPTPKQKRWSNCAENQAFTRGGSGYSWHFTSVFAACGFTVIIHLIHTIFTAVTVYLSASRLVFFGINELLLSYYLRHQMSLTYTR